MVQANPSILAVCFVSERTIVLFYSIGADMFALDVNSILFMVPERRSRTLLPNSSVHEVVAVCSTV